MGEEEATLRERLIEAMVGAMRARYGYRGDVDVESATAALDAALGMLVSETMAQFDEQIAVYETKKDQAWKADMQERFDRFENYRDAADYMRSRIDDMLATLRSPKI